MSETQGRFDAFDRGSVGGERKLLKDVVVDASFGHRHSSSRNNCYASCGCHHIDSFTYAKFFYIATIAFLLIFTKRESFIRKISGISRI